MCATRSTSAPSTSISTRAARGSIGSDGDDLDVDSRSGGHLFAQAAQDVFITEVDGMLDVLAARALGGQLRLTVPDTSAADTENLNLRAGGTAQLSEGAATPVTQGEITAFATIALWVGDNVTTNAASRIVAGQGIAIRGDTRRVGKTNNVDDVNADAGRGTQMDLRGTIGYIAAPASVTAVNGTAKTFTRIYGHDDVDTFTFNQTRLDANTARLRQPEGPAAACSRTTARTASSSTSSPRCTSTAKARATRSRSTASPTATTTRCAPPAARAANPQNYVINVLDTGAKDDGVDELKILGFDGTLNGSGQPTDDIFLLRGMTAIPSETAESPAFVALLHGSLARRWPAPSPLAGRADQLRRQPQRPADRRRPRRQRLLRRRRQQRHHHARRRCRRRQLPDRPDLRLRARQRRRRQPRRRRTPSTSPPSRRRAAISAAARARPLVAEGGSGDDMFQVYSNQAALRLEGDDGNDLFVVRAFALAADRCRGQHPLRRDRRPAAWPDVKLKRLLDGGDRALLGGAGNDLIEYNINAPVSVDGGAGFDKVLVLGTEFGDSFVITDQGVFGAGLNVTYANIESLEVDGLEGDDHFTVQSTPFGVATRVVGGLGNDIFNVAARRDRRHHHAGARGPERGHQPRGHVDGDIGYDGLIASGINLNVAGLPGSAAAADSAATSSSTSPTARAWCARPPAATGAPSTRYTVRLAVAPAAGTKIYVTVSAARSPQEEQDAAGKGDSVLVSTDRASFERTVVVNGVPRTERNRAVVLVFDSTNWNQVQTVYVAAANDSQAEGRRVVAVSHSVQAVVDAIRRSAAAQAATIAAYNGIKVRNVLVTVIDNDTAGILLTEMRRDAYDNGTLVLEGDATHGITDQYTVELTKAPTSRRGDHARATTAGSSSCRRPR